MSEPKFTKEALALLEWDFRIDVPQASNLAAYALRLVSENEALREVVRAADAFFLTEDAMVNAPEEGAGKDLWLESQEHRDAYDAARARLAEIEKGGGDD